MIDISSQPVKEEGLFVLYGKPGTGKTYVANVLAQDGPTAVITFDKSHSVLKDNIESGKIKVFMLDTDNDFKEKNFQRTLDSMEETLKPFKYIVFDNISALEQELISKSKDKLGAKDTRQAYGLFQAEMFALAQLCVELPGITFVTCWEKMGESEFGPIPVPDLNAKVLGSFGGLGQGVFHMTKHDGNFSINSNGNEQMIYVKNRKNNIPMFTTENLVRFLGVND